eukprot:COSAG06_NODE_4555_length_4151_cov_8.091807_1_plen_82_part_00
MSDFLPTLTIIKVRSLAVLHVASSRGLLSTRLVHQCRKFKRILLDICAKDVSTHERMMWKSRIVLPAAQTGSLTQVWWAGI